MAVTLERVTEALGALAPLRLAESWDNVGLVVEPKLGASFERALLTIDLTEAVLDEALKLGATLIIAYHPPIFSGLKRLRLSSVHERTVVRALTSGITIYSPHTALDAAVGGMNDWLSEALGPAEVEPIVSDLELPGAGAGRHGLLKTPASLADVLGRIKAHLGLSHLRVSAPDSLTEVRTFAVCPGAGGSLFEKVGQVDLLLTGEMRHHDVLSRRAKNTAVVLTDHTNTERGYLPRFKERLTAALPELAVQVSARDADPLQIV